MIPFVRELEMFCPPGISNPAMGYTHTIVNPSLDQFTFSLSTLGNLLSSTILMQYLYMSDASISSINKQPINYLVV